MIGIRVDSEGSGGGIGDRRGQGSDSVGSGMETCLSVSGQTQQTYPHVAAAQTQEPLYTCTVPFPCPT